MNAAEIRQMLREAIDQFPERDEMLADLGLQTRHSHAPMWLTGIGLLGLGLGLGAVGGMLLGPNGIRERTRPKLWTTIGSAVLGAGAGAAVFALVSDEVGRSSEAGESSPNPESRIASSP